MNLIPQGGYDAAKACRPRPNAKAGSNLKKQGLDFCLDEVLVGGQSFGYSALLHEHEGNTIGEAPILVRALFEEPISGFEQRPVERHDFDVRVAAQPIEKRDSGDPVRDAGQRGANFKNACVGRDDFVIAALEVSAEAFGICMIPIARRKQRDCVSGIEKNDGTHYA